MTDDRSITTRQQLDKWLEEMNQSNIGGSLIMLFMWNEITYVWEDLADWEYQPAEGVDLDQVWDTFWNKPWGGFDVEGSDVLDWLIDNDLVDVLDELYEDGEIEDV